MINFGRRSYTCVPCQNGNNYTFIPFQKGNSELQTSLEDATLQRSSFTETGMGAAGHSYDAEAMGCRGWSARGRDRGRESWAGRRGCATVMVRGPWAASCREDRHKGHGGAAATPPPPPPPPPSERE